MSRLTSRCHALLAAPLLLTALGASATAILYDHRAVGMVGWVKGDAPLDFHSIRDEIGASVNGLIGHTVYRVGSDPYFMNSHASLDAWVYPERPFSVQGEAQAQFRNFSAGEPFTGERQSQFYTYSTYQVDFRTSVAAPLSIGGQIGVNKGMWTLESPLESQSSLTVYLELVRYVGGLGGIAESLYSARLTHEDLFNPACPIGSTHCNTFFVPAVASQIAYLRDLDPGDYGFSVSALASSISNWDVPVTQDGSAWFAVALGIPEPSTITLAVLALAGVAGSRWRGTAQARASVGRNRTPSG